MTVARQLRRDNKHSHHDPYRIRYIRSMAALMIAASTLLAAAATVLRVILNHL
jgi:hypothetical protein